MKYIDRLGENAKKCKGEIAFASTEQKNDALLEIAHILRVCKNDIIKANNIDLENAKLRKMSESLQDRLILNEKRIESMASACENVAKLADPIGEVVSGSTRPNGMKIERVRVPMGVIGIIYEARPNVTVDAAILCIKSGNAVILRGGKEAINSNKCLCELMRKAVERAGFDPDIFRLVEDTDRGIVCRQTIISTCLFREAVHSLSRLWYRTLPYLLLKRERETVMFTLTRAQTWIWL